MLSSISDLLESDGFLNEMNQTDEEKEFEEAKSKNRCPDYMKAGNNTPLDDEITTASSGISFLAGSLISTVYSWDGSELDYDTKSTKKVEEMLDALESLLFKDDPNALQSSNKGHNLVTTTALKQECENWSLLFPHLRVRGRHVLESKETAFQLISRRDALSKSPYFMIPEKKVAIHDTTQVTLELIAIKLSKQDIVGSASNHGDTANDTTSEGHNSTVEARQSQTTSKQGNSIGLVDWSDPEVQLALTSFKNRILLPVESHWAVFSVNVLNSEPAGNYFDLSNDDDGSRCQTPTPQNIHELTLSQGTLGIGKKIKINVSKTCKGSKSELKDYLTKQSQHPDFEDLVNCFIVIQYHNGSSEEPRSNVDIFAWNRVSQLSFDLNSHLIPHSVVRSPPHRIFSTIDLWTQFEAINATIFDMESLENVVELLQTTRQEECLGTAKTLGETESFIVQNGVINECFAQDHSSEYHFDRQRNSRTDAVLLSPDNSIQQDIISNVFEELWAEILPEFKPLLESNRNIASFPETSLANNDPSSPSPVFIDNIIDITDSEDDDISDLLSAMTIRPIPLQKRRDLTATSTQRTRTETSYSQLMGPESSLNMASSRPMSAKPLLQRPASARMSLNRPTSARNQEIVSGSSSLMLHRAQNNAPSKTINSKRNALMTRLLPLASPITTVTNSGPAINDMIYGTSISSLKQKMAIQNSVKRLPPIRGIVSTGIDTNYDTNLKSKQSKHVVFDHPNQSDSIDVTRLTTSPRPFSARRQGSASKRIPRPHTAMAIDAPSGLRNSRYSKIQLKKT